MKNFISVCLLSFSFVTTSGLAANKWDMPTPYADGVHHTQNIRQFAAELKTASKGELNINVHSGASLFKHPEIYRAVRTGQVNIGEIFMGLLGNDNPVFNVDNIPFLASDFVRSKKLWDVQKPHVEAQLAKDGLQLLYVVPWPPQGFYTKKPLTSVSDFQAMKLRAYSPMTSRLAILLGAAPTTVQTPEIPQAFATGLVEAMVTSPSTGVSSQAWDFVEHYTDTQAWIPKNMVFVNARAFKRLSTEQQQQLLTAAAKAEVRGWEMAIKETAVKTAQLKKNGMHIHAPTAAFKTELEKIGQVMGQEWAKEAGSKGSEILQKMR